MNVEEFLQSANALRNMYQKEGCEYSRLKISVIEEISSAICYNGGYPSQYSINIYSVSENIAVDIAKEVFAKLIINVAFKHSSNSSYVFDTLAK